MLRSFERIKEALKFLKSEGIGLARYLPSDQYCITGAFNDDVYYPPDKNVPDIGRLSKYFKRALTKENFLGENQYFFAS